MKKLDCPALPFFPGRKKQRALFLNEKLKVFYPEATCALEFQGDPFRLLVMARLSAQCTDQRVNEVSVPLFLQYPDAKAMAEAELSCLEDIVRPCGLFRSKAKQIREMSRIITERYQGEVPKTKPELLALPGVGEKIANLMLGDVFGEPHIVADTHCIRLAGRFRLVKSDRPETVTRELEKLIPTPEQSDFCHRIITLGREYCRAQNPRCEECPFRIR